MSTSDKPRFLQAAEARAERLGLTAAAILEIDRKRVRESKYPTAECLDPHEVEAAVQNSLETLPPARQAHVEQCTACAGLLALAVPDMTRLEDTLEELRRLVEFVPVRGDLKPFTPEEWEESLRPVAVLQLAANG